MCNVTTSETVTSTHLKSTKSDLKCFCACLDALSSHIEIPLKATYDHRFLILKKIYIHPTGIDCLILRCYMYHHCTYSDHLCR